MACHADSPFLLDDLPRLYLLPAGAPEGRKPKPAQRFRWRLHQNRVLASFAGVEDRDAAEALRGVRVYARKADMPRLEEDEFYVFELEGLQVFAPDGPDGEPGLLGVIDEVRTPAGQELWVIKTPDGREVLFPAAEAFIDRVEPAAGRVFISPPPGLLELYLQP